MLINEKIKASLFLLSYFETLGFNNGIWEFNYNYGNIKDPLQSAYIWISILHSFFAKGGFSNIDLTNWKSSDDTILAIATSIGCLKGGTEKNYIDEYSKILDELKNPIRGSGIATLNSLELIKRTRKITSLKYDKKMGGNGAAMRCSVIGLIYNKSNEIEKLIETSLVASRVTHNYSLGFLGGIISALFTNYAINNIPIWQWVDNLLNLYKKKTFDKIIKKTNIYNEYLKDKDEFFDKWEEYNENKLSKFKFKPGHYMHYDNRIESLDVYNTLNGKLDYQKYGASGISSLIIAYDALLMSFSSSGNIYNLENPEKLNFSLDSLLFFSTLHFGDNDTTGAIAGAWYGAFFGFKDFDKNKLKQLEFNDKLNKLYELIISKLKI